MGRSRSSQDPDKRSLQALWKVLVCEFQEYGGECRGSGSSLLIFIELAPSKNDNCEEVKGLLSVFQKHGGECTGLLLILNVAEIRPIEADKLLRRIRKRQRERLREGGSSRRVTTGPAGHRVMRDQHSVDTR